MNEWCSANQWGESHRRKLAEVGGSMRVCYVKKAHAFLKEASFLAGPPPGMNDRHVFFPEFL